MMPRGRRSKCSRTSAAMRLSSSLPVPKVFTEMEVGSATPMA